MWTQWQTELAEHEEVYITDVFADAELQRDLICYLFKKETVIDYLSDEVLIIQQAFPYDMIALF